MIRTDENRAVLHVEVIFWSSKRKTPPSLVSGMYSPHFVVTGTTEYLVCASWMERSVVHLMSQLWGMLSSSIQILWTMVSWKTMRNLIFEGANVVGKGRVLGRTVPYKVKQQRK